MIALEAEAVFLGVTPAMLKIIGAVAVVSLTLGVIQRVRQEVGA